MAHENEPDNTSKDKPVYDERTLGRVLEAAYILQEHNRRQQERELREVERQTRQPAAIEPARPAAIPKPTPRTESGFPAARNDAGILAQIVDTQHQIQVRHLAPEPAMSLIVQRVMEATNAAGAAIGILDGRNFRYRAIAGALTVPVGTEMPMEKALCAACLRVGEVIRCADVNPDFLIDAAQCHRRGIQSLIAVPIYHDGKVTGGLEVYYPDTYAFTEPDVHTCQLMAGLITEAHARNQELTWKSSLASERAVMLEALERLKPNLVALAETAKAKDFVAPQLAHPAPVKPAAPSPAICRKCGHKLMEDEQFCGQCGLPHSGGYEPSSIQSKVASMLFMQEAARKAAAAPPPPAPVPSESPANSAGSRPEPVAIQPGQVADVEAAEVAEIHDALPELFRLPARPAGKVIQADLHEAGAFTQESLTPNDAAEKRDIVVFPDEQLLDQYDNADELKEEESSKQEADDAELTSPVTALAKSDASSHWSSAITAQRFLEQLGQGKRSGAVARFLGARRGQVYLVLAVILTILVLRWGVWSGHSVSATGSPGSAAHHRADADLPLYDRMLIKLGLADPPDPPENKGNPNTQVWVDLQTALYYCPGSDLYGKSPKGKFATQRDAQLDQFQPAYRKVCY
jgi:putative methionine-R-sulfoxide reductase with GAF domain